MSETTIENATTSATKTTKGKTPKKSVKAKAATPKTETPNAANAQRDKKPKAPRESREGWGTFALKMPVPEREAFHTAAGPASASHFARIVLVAFTNEDEGAFKSALAGARKLRA